MKKITVLFTIMYLMILTAQAFAAEGSGVYLTFDGRAMFEICMVNFTGKDIHLYNRNSSNANSGNTVFSPGKPMWLRSGKSPADFCIIVDGTGINHFCPVFRCGNDGDEHSTEFNLRMDIEGRPDNIGVSGAVDGWQIFKWTWDRIKNVINFENPDSYVNMIYDTKDLIDKNSHNKYRLVPSAVHLVTNTDMGTMRLDKSVNGEMPNDTATYLIINNKIKDDDQLVIQSIAYRSNGSDDWKQKINGDKFPEYGNIYAEDRHCGRIVVTAMTYGEWRKTIGKLINAGVFSQTDTDWLKEIDNKQELLRKSAEMTSDKGGLIQ